MTAMMLFSRNMYSPKTKFKGKRKNFGYGGKKTVLG